MVSGSMEPRSDDFPLLANMAAAMMTVVVSSTMVEVDAQAASVRMALLLAMLARTVAGLSSAIAAAPILSMKTPISCEPPSPVAVLLLHFDGLLSWSGHAWT